MASIKENFGEGMEEPVALLMGIKAFLKSEKAKKLKEKQRQVNGYLKNGQSMPLFVYFCHFQQKLKQKNCSLQRDSILDHQSR